MENELLQTTQVQIAKEPKEAKAAVTKPKLSFWQIWNMSFGFLGIQFGFALQNANVSRIFETLGAGIDEIPILWIAAPVTGLLVQPIVGYYSDRTWNRFGRRRPFFLFGAIFASLALIMMPNSSALWIAAGLLWIMDASINVSMEPFRAFVGDMLPNDQLTKGFAFQSFFIGIGAVIASALPYMMTNWFGIPNTAPEGQIPASVEISFYLGALAFLGAVIWTVIKSKEYSPQELAAYHPEQVSEEKPGSGLSTVIKDFMSMPKTMAQLAIVQFFSWFALFSMWIYTTAAVTKHIYSSTDPTSVLYNEGADWVGICFAAYNGFAAIFAFTLPVLAKHTSRKITHMICLTAGGAGLISIFFISDPMMLIVSMIGVGLAWSSILSMPYAILAGSLPASKMGLYMGIFNFFIVIPQILAAGILGYITKNMFGGEAIYTLVFGGCSMIIAAVLTMLVKDKE
jgi:maltose/moltooligosaccharide transporter